MLTFFKIVLKLCGYFVQALWLCVRIIYRILKALRIRVLALYLLVTGILQLIWHTFDGGNIIVFWIGFAVCVALSFMSWTYVFYKKEKKRLRREQERAAKREKKQKRGPEEAEEPKKKQKRKKEDVAKFYEVEGKPDYMFAEYADRYELYRKEKGKLVLVRTDKKEGEEK